MANAEKIARINDNVGRAVGRIKDLDGSTPTPPPEPTPEKEKDTLDDSVRQHDIMHPEGKEVELTYGKLKLYPPSIEFRRSIFGFCTDTLADVLERMPLIAPRTTGEQLRYETVINMRVAARINRSPDVANEIIFFTARLLGPPGKIDDEKAIELGTEIAEHAHWRDLATLFAHLSAVSGADALSDTAKNSVTRPNSP